MTKTSTRWRWRVRRLRSRPADLLIVLLVALVVVVAVDRGWATHRLSWALVIFAIVAVASIIFHEVSHGVVAYWCGDDTAKRAGRLSANPARHIDPIGSIVVPLVLIVFHGPAFGWARPVPVSLNRLRRPRNQAIIVALAGPASNGLLAVLAGLAEHFIMAGNLTRAAYLYFSIGNLQTYTSASSLLYWIGLVVGLLGLANLFIGAFNLIPIPPLDGSAVLERFIPVSALPTYYRLRMVFIVLVLLVVWLDRGFIGTVYSDLARWYLGLFTPPFRVIVG